MLQILRWSAGRVVSALITLLGVSVLIFVAIRLMPGSYEDIILGPLASAEERQLLAEAYGLNQPIFVQYFAWIGQVLTGELGTSYVTQSSVSGEMIERIPVTATLTIMAMAVTLLAGVPLGIWTGVRSGAKQGGAVGRVVSSIGISVPEFVLGSIVIFLFSQFSLGLKVSGFASIGTGFWPTLGALLLPALVLSVFCVAATARTTRDAVMGVLVEPHITAAVARGETAGHIVRHHVLRNAGIPILTLLGTDQKFHGRRELLRLAVLGTAGAILGYLALFFGTVLIGLVWVLLLAAVRPLPSEQERFRLALQDGAAVTAGIVGSLLAHALLAAATFDGAFALVIDQLHHRMTGAARNSMLPELNPMFAERELSVALLLEKLDGHLWRLGFGSATVGRWCAGVSLIGSVALPAAGALRQPHRRAAWLVLAACALATPLWFVLFLEHSITHAGVMVRLLHLNSAAALLGLFLLCAPQAKPRVREQAQAANR